MIEDIRQRRSILKHQGRFAEAIPLQLQILEDAKTRGWRDQIASAWNYLSMLYYRTKQYAEAEAASLESIANHDDTLPNSDESLATYEMLLAKILAAQYRFDEAVRYGELATAHYATFHNPPTNFLAGIKEEVDLMGSYRDRRSKDDG